MKTRGRKRVEEAAIDFEEEDFRDEVDQFNDERKKLKKDSYRRASRADADEVLNVEGDISEEESGDESSDFDDDDNDDDAQTSNQWGRKRRDYYNTDYVDKDWGGMRDEEMEEAELEEADALARQKELDKAAAVLLDNLDDEPLAAPQKDAIEKDTPLEWNFDTVKRLNKDTSKLIEEFTQRKELMTIIIEPLRKVAESLPKTTILCKQLFMVIDVYSKYLLNLTFILNEKANSFSKKEFKNELLTIHPVNEEILRSKMMIKKVDSFLEKNSDELNHLIEMNVEGKDLTTLNLPEIKKKKNNIRSLAKESTQVEVDSGNEQEADRDEKRKAPGLISKNKETTKTTKKKKDRHSKLTNRRKFKQIQKKVKSQIGQIRREDAKYSGEARGIRASTIKSIKLS